MIRFPTIPAIGPNEILTEAFVNADRFGEAPSTTRRLCPRDLKSLLTRNARRWDGAKESNNPNHSSCRISEMPQPIPTIAPL
jgi:hypothetical protein